MDYQLNNKAMTKQQIIEARKMGVDGLLSVGFTSEELFQNNILCKAYYLPSDTYEYFDGEFYYNAVGQPLRDPQEYNPHSEGYTPFGDE